MPQVRLVYAETASNPDCRDPSALQQLLLLGKGGKTAAKIQVSSGSDQQGESMLIHCRDCRQLWQTCDCVCECSFAQTASACAGAQGCHRSSFQPA